MTNTRTDRDAMVAQLANEAQPTDNTEGVRNVLTHDEQERVRIMAEYVFVATKRGYPNIRELLTETLLLPGDEFGRLVVRTTDQPDPETMVRSDSVPDWLEIVFLDGVADDEFGSVDEGDDLHAYRVLNHIVTTDQAGHQAVTTYATQREAEVAFIVANAYQQYS